jgi:hypothetical protein
MVELTVPGRRVPLEAVMTTDVALDASAGPPLEFSSCTAKASSSPARGTTVLAGARSSANETGAEEGRAVVTVAVDDATPGEAAPMTATPADPDVVTPTCRKACPAGTVTSVGTVAMEAFVVDRKTWTPEREKVGAPDESTSETTSAGYVPPSAGRVPGMTESETALGERDDSPEAAPAERRAAAKRRESARARARFNVPSGLHGL